MLETKGTCPVCGREAKRVAVEHYGDKIFCVGCDRTVQGCRCLPIQRENYDKH